MDRWLRSNRVFPGLSTVARIVGESLFPSHVAVFFWLAMVTIVVVVSMVGVVVVVVVVVGRVVLTFILFEGY